MVIQQEVVFHPDWVTEVSCDGQQMGAGGGGEEAGGRAVGGGEGSFRKRGANPPMPC